MNNTDFYGVATKAVEQWKASQNITELAFALRIIHDFHPKVILEIGVEQGGSIAAWAEVSSPELVIGIDFMSLHKEGEFLKNVKNRIQEYDIKMITNVSSSPETLEQLREMLNGRTIDFLFIDADHRYNEVLKDWQLYKPFLSKKAIVGFHDIRYDEQLWDAGSQVSFLWDRLKREYSYDEFYRESNMGIGFLYI